MFPCQEVEHVQNKQSKQFLVLIGKLFKSNQFILPGISLEISFTAFGLMLYAVVLSANSDVMLCLHCLGKSLK